MLLEILGQQVEDHQIVMERLVFEVGVHDSLLLLDLNLLDREHVHAWS